MCVYKYVNIYIRIYIVIIYNLYILNIYMYI